MKAAAGIGVAGVLVLGALAADGSSRPDDNVAPDAAPAGAALEPTASGSEASRPDTPGAVHPAAPGEIVVYKSPTCGCCTRWVDHMRASGFTVVAHDTADVAAVKRRLGVPAGTESCHTSIVDGYVIEGHVPAADVKRLLAERPSVAGIAVPGMPMGSPGMEGPRIDRYDVMSFDKSGRTAVFSSH